MIVVIYYSTVARFEIRRTILSEAFLSRKTLACSRVQVPTIRNKKQASNVVDPSLLPTNTSQPHPALKKSKLYPTLKVLQNPPAFLLSRLRRALIHLPTPPSFSSFFSCSPSSSIIVNSSLSSLPLTHLLSYTVLFSLSSQPNPLPSTPPNTLLFTPPPQNSLPQVIITTHYQDNPSPSVNKSLPLSRPCRRCCRLKLPHLLISILGRVA